jgi:succinate-semialdehyde dehydrogenase / glutarate-semialdehyde dehydrogenase
MSSSPSETSVIDAVPKQLLIGGEWRDGGAGTTFEVEDPSTGEPLCEIADATADDAAVALDAAVAARGDWAATPSNERSEILYEAFRKMGERVDALALLMTLEMGKAVAESRGEVAYAAEFFRWNAGEALRIDGYYKQAGNGSSRVLVMRQPVGPCYLITPWNFPAAMGTRKIGPAIAAGCTMVIKPAQFTPLSMLALGEILQECGLPPGVLNILTTTASREVSEPIIRDPRLRKLSFTGSTEVGQKLIEQAGERVLNVSMELGGNAPFLVFEDADLDAAVDGAMVAKMRNVGEACTAANRFHVHQAVAGEFTAKLSERMAALTVGRGSEPGTDVGPLIDDDSRSKVAELVEDAVAKGATVRCGGNAGSGAGYFFEPTVIGEVSPDARLLKEEIFGPVAPVTSFSTDEEAIAAANDTEYGLVAYMFTRDINRALNVAEALETGMIGLNQGLVSNAGAPFGGVKSSGIGREGGNEGIEEYLETKYIAVNV